MIHFVEKITDLDNCLKKNMIGSEVVFDENMIETAYKKFQSNPKLMWIPIKGCEHIFLERSQGAEGDEMEGALIMLKQIQLYHSIDVEEILGEKNVLLLGVDEFTCRLYFVLKNMNVKVILNGELWRTIGMEEGICEEENVLTSTEVIEILLRAGSISDKQNALKIKNFYREKCATYLISIPSAERLEIAPGRKRMSELWGHMYALKNSEKDYLERYCKLKYDEIIRNKSSLTEEYGIHPTEISGGEERTIFLVGPCIVEGVSSFEKYSLARLLYDALKKKGINYKIVRVIIPSGSGSAWRKIHEYDVKSGDMIFCVGEKIEYADIDMGVMFNQDAADAYWFQDKPIHTNCCGNEAIVSQMMPFVEKNWQNRVEKDVYVQIGVPHLTYTEEEKLKKWMQQVQTELPMDRFQESQVGAIVMNGNPFTYGHQYLVEKAAASVDYLVVFTVQEDASEFMFEDRYKLMKEGTRHIKNVFVVPSGEFVLSKRTMHAYFSKDELQDEIIDAAGDVRMFGCYIAPQFHITVRFVGEEPIDKVTNQYNTEMKKVLPHFGVEVREIPRLRKDDKVISASLVREWYLQGKWGELKKIVPEATYSFLKTMPTMRRKQKGRTNWWSDVFENNSHVILYATGRACLNLYQKELSKTEKEKVIFCDKMAGQGEIRFQDKSVMKPQDLLCREYSQYPIIITTTLYAAEVKKELCSMGIEAERIYFNKKKAPRA